MPSILSHIAVPIAGRIALGKHAIAPSLLALGLLASVLPDADVLLMRLGVPYDSPFGHRGASHSILFVAFVATVFAIAWSRLHNRSLEGPLLYLFLCAASHPLLDTCTNAGHGAALLWPVSPERFFAPFRPIEASPLSLRRFFGEPGLRVLVSEGLWVWLPCLLLGGFYALGRVKRNVA